MPGKRNPQAGRARPKMKAQVRRQVRRKPTAAQRAELERAAKLGGRQRPNVQRSRRS